METFSALLAICAGNSPGTGEIPAQRPMTRSFDVFFDLRLNKRLSRQSWGWWFETLWRPLWRHRSMGFLSFVKPVVNTGPFRWSGDSSSEGINHHSIGQHLPWYSGCATEWLKHRDLCKMSAILLATLSKSIQSWWSHQMQTISALLALCAGNSQVTVEFPAQRPVAWSFDVFFDLGLNKRLSKQSWGWWFETPSWSLWHHCNDIPGIIWLNNCLSFQFLIMCVCWIQMSIYIGVNIWGKHN